MNRMSSKLKWDSLTITAAVVAAIGMLLTPVLDPYGIDDITTAFNAGLPLAFWAASIAGATFVAFILPRLRAGSLARTWRVPSSTYLFPRWVVCTSLGVIIGGFVAR
jgi:hypothetical protein